jgi:hypothetical protein
MLVCAAISDLHSFFCAALSVGANREPMLGIGFRR